MWLAEELLSGEVDYYYKMKKLTQKLKNGEIQVIEVPPPVLGPGKTSVCTFKDSRSPNTKHCRKDC